MKQVKVYMSSGIYDVNVESGKETVHPDSPHRTETCILDDRIPADIIVECLESGAVTVHSARRTTLDWGDKIQVHVKLCCDEEEENWYLMPDKDGIFASWHANWWLINVVSKSHGQHVLDLLSQGDTEIGTQAKIVVR